MLHNGPRLDARFSLEDNADRFGLSSHRAAPREAADTAFSLGDAHSLGLSGIRFDPRAPGDAAAPIRLDPVANAPSPTYDEQVSFLTGVKPNGTVVTDPDGSYWTFSGETARKWDTPTAGEGATITYAFNPASSFSANEKNTFLKAFGLWEAVADVKFVAAGVGAAEVLLTRGSDGSAYFQSVATNGSGAALGQYVGQTLISIDDSTLGFELTGSLDTIGGYGMSTVIHEVGHLLGLGHGGYYNGAVDPATEQFSAFDERQWSIMSYIFYANDDARYFDQYTVTGTDWGVTEDEYLRQASHTWMPADITAIQQLYGVAQTSPLDGGDTFGFNSSIGGIIAQFFDFTINEHPVITLFSLGLDNALDASGFAPGAFIDLNPGAFSSLNGAINNVAIAFGTIVETGIGGEGADTIEGGDVDNTLYGNAGTDVLSGNAGDDVLIGGADRDVLAGGAGVDWASYIDAAVGVVADLGAPAANAGDAFKDRYLGIENLTGSAFNDTLRGDALGNMLDGGGKKDELSGGGGKDTLLGGKGQDTLEGGGDKDQFLLDSAKSKDADTIIDFAAREKIALLGDAFDLAPGSIAPGAFVLGTSAGDASDRIIYHQPTGRLWFDADGSGGGAQVLIARLSNNAVLAATDFVVI